MKKHYFFLLFYLVSLKLYSQNPDNVLDIDSIITSNADKVEIVYQRTEKNRIWASHGRNPKYILYMYRLTFDNILLSTTYIAFSIGDTALLINYYFNSGELIRVNAIEFDKNNHRVADLFYFSNNQLINKNSKIAGRYQPDYHLERATKLLKKLKKKPIRFPE